MPPPNCLRMRRARSIIARLPHSTDPTGAHSPLLKQKVIESAGAASSAGVTASAAAALKMRAPSMCNNKSCSCANTPAARVYSGLKTTPPQRLCVFSRMSIRLMGWCTSAGRTAARTSSRSRVPSARLSSVCGNTPPSAEIPPPSNKKVCPRLPMMTSSPRWHCARTAIRFPIVPEGTNKPASLPMRSAAIS